MTDPAAPAVFVVAGHDPTGGAGVDADAEAGRRFGVRVEAVVTARTRQDGRRVEALGARSPEDWAHEAEDRGCGRYAVWKSGLLPGAEHVRALARLLGEARRTRPARRSGEKSATGADAARPLEGPPGGWGLGMDGAGAALPLLVLDPVLAASGGEPFLDEDGVHALLEELLPLAPVLTPNLPEAARLSGLEPAALARSLEARREAARQLLARGAAAILLKGGHAADDPACDLVALPGRPPVELRHARVPGQRIHGSGCRYASAVACGLARGASLVEAAAAAGGWLEELLRRAAGQPGNGARQLAEGGPDTYPLRPHRRL